jgi:hypothetical protein
LCGALGSRAVSAMFPLTAERPCLCVHMAVQMLAALRERLLRVVLDKLRMYHDSRTGDVDELRPLWRVSAWLNDEQGSVLFSQWLGADFADAGHAIYKTATAALAVRSIASASVSKSLPASLPASSSSTAQPALGTEQPFIQSLFELLTMAATWISGVMAEVEVDGQPVPNRARSTVVVQLHKCVHMLLLPLLPLLLLVLILWLNRVLPSHPTPPAAAYTLSLAGSA